ncbi:phosphopantothenoylcysteine decarboxylase/phosphopantothenate--cysteine ligase [Arthrobacter sp. PvP102]|uniref:bifunctional phosphopantothenoylcysteine decarboxylase/phosphopantothenate--cysteine ligase CoaBC n=1 Tax=unclassified Arthrobacter TaxID=235627 RepID=UPI001AE613A0|nr:MULTISPECIES: bifunctional phosphopantothenoylcysteine decarboxylase/phosphopantothenate--cysteine ligase CoaBC [unclassified Arthrobacter]MBP1231553.1 phosphopantothenoylcysteine decarboxylase/phosphopantothenate--cysteine ligase [Arthrobacter sp. PvP103]MBP1236688.1 phosphopantothenoylcysteine decarboxylase/phosphopantothenate--cysteine ligase [Arthrobacter sp. PvP102]
MRIVLGVGGGIAAYKVASLLRLFTEAGHNVTVIPTEAANRFVGVATWEALSGNPVSNSVFDDVPSVNHVRLGHEADLIVVAPATADLLARAAGGHANDLLTNTLLMASGPVLMAPAMHTEMWQHPATQANVETLRGRGVTVLEPASGRLTGSDSGPGRLPEPEAIFSAAMALMQDSGVSGQLPLAGRTVTISAGGTREPLDPVRFLGNRSSGKQGVALAVAARDAGASVRLLAAHMDVPAPAGVEVVRVETALQLREEALRAAVDSDVVIMAAAVADFRPANVSDTKIKKRDDTDDPVISLLRNPDILQELVEVRAANKPGQLIVGFAAETGDAHGDVLAYAEAKLRKKGCDLLVVNHVGEGLVFGQDHNSVVILSRSGSEPQAASGSKDDVAATVIDRISYELSRVFPRS